MVTFEDDNLHIPSSCKEMESYIQELRTANNDEGDDDYSEEEEESDDDYSPEEEDETIEEEDDEEEEEEKKEFSQNPPFAQGQGCHHEEEDSWLNLDDSNQSETGQEKKEEEKKESDQEVLIQKENSEETDNREEGEEKADEEQEDEEEFSDWEKEGICQEEVDSVFYVEFEEPSCLFAFYESQNFPQEHLVALQSTRISPISLPSDILLSRVWEEYEARFNNAEHLTAISSEASEHDESELSHCTDFLNESGQSNCLETHSASTQDSLVVKLTMSRLISREKMILFLRKSPYVYHWQAEQPQDWHRNEILPHSKPSSFLIFFQRAFDFVRLIEADLSFPLDSVISVKSNSERLHLPNNILTPQGWRQTRALLKAVHTEHEEGFKQFSKQKIYELQIELVLDAKINPAKVDSYLKKSKYVLSHRYLRTLSVT